MQHKLQVRSRLGKILAARRRLLVAALAGLGLFAALPESVRMTPRLLLAWDLTATIYVGAALYLVFRSRVEDCQARAALYDQSDWVIMSLVVASAAASFAAIFVELGAIKASPTATALSLTVTGVTVVLSWAFTHTIFALHYANVYYRPHRDGPPGGLQFPGGREPDYRDFLYYSFVIGCAAQTGDIATLSGDMRVISLLHGIIAFVFNTTILALAINVGAGLL